MWRSLVKVATPLVRTDNCLLNAENLLQQQLRTTFILKRREAPFLSKKGFPLKKLRTRHYIYDLVEDTNIKKLPNIEVILTSFVSSLGNAGDRVSVKSHFAYNDLLLPGLAVYATPENIAKFENQEKKIEEEHYSSPTALRMIGTLSRMKLSVVMNKDNPWTLEPWHIRTSFRKCGYVVPEEAIEMPSKPIKGPDLSLEEKHFFITVTINRMEKVKVKCMIHHWSTDQTERLPHIEQFWMKTEPLFPEDASINHAETSKENS